MSAHLAARPNALRPKLGNSPVARSVLLGLRGLPFRHIGWHKEIARGIGDNAAYDALKLNSLGVACNVVAGNQHRTCSLFRDEILARLACERRARS